MCMMIALQSRLSINKHSVILITRTVSDYFHLKTDLLFEETKSGKALASLVAPSPTPLVCIVKHFYSRLYSD